MAYVNQIKIAGEVFNLFSKGKKEVVLHAQMQSGKTGAYTQLLYSFKGEVPFKIGNKKYVLLSSADNLLKSQINKEVHGSNNTENLETEVLHNTKEDLKRIQNQENGTLFIVDESHVAIGKSRKFGAFLCKLKENPLNRFVYISATNMDADYHSEAEKVIMPPGEGYYGICEMLAANRIFRSDKILIDGKISNSFLNEIDTLIPGNYAIARVHSERIANTIKKKLQKLTPDLKVSIVHSKLNNIDYVDTVTVPSKGKELILISSSLRMGKVLDTRYITFLWDTPMSNTDTAVQSLAGRACGYNKKDHNVRIFTDKDEMENYSRIIKNNFDSRIVSWKTTNTSNSEITTIYSVPKVLALPKSVSGKSYDTILNYLTMTKPINTLVKKHRHKLTLRDLRKYEKENGRERETGTLKAVENGIPYAFGVDLKKAEKFNGAISLDGTKVFLYQRLDSPEKDLKTRIKKVTHYQRG